MSEIDSAPLSQFADVVMGQSPDASRCGTEERGLPFLQGSAEFGLRHPQSVMFCNPPLRIARAGSVLISVRAPVGAMNYADQDYCIGRGLGAFRAKSGVSDSVFLKHAVELSGPWLHRRSQGSTFAAVSTSDVRTIPIPTFNVTTQKKIAAILTSIDDAIERTQSLIAKYQQIKAGLMHDLFTRGVLPNGQLRPPREQAPNLYRETAIGWIPKEWEVGFVEDCGEVKLGRQRSPDQHSGKWATPYLRVANVFDGFIDYSDVLEMDFTPNERKIFGLEYGDILLNEGQSLELVGRSSIYRGESNRYCFQNTLIRFRCDVSHCADFFAHLFKLWLDAGAFQRIAKQTTSVAHLGADRFARMRCPRIKLGEQQRIADRINAIDVCLNASAIALMKLRTQKLGLMQDLLTGKVPVQVDASQTETA
jgi:type I restriction enzyme S subunit